MQPVTICYKRHWFLRQIVAHVVWLCTGFILSLREVEEMMLARGVDVSYEPIRRKSPTFRSC
ncbi:transposase (plasmid) [Antarctobacter heliothermus]|uniref:Transposase n=1 Tax=Antarctobacter heliothermus TaxID=74033 RepID=A0A222EBL3_9RHOB|nr:transposase [Antarctobacter heliothermus]